MKLAKAVSKAPGANVQSEKLRQNKVIKVIYTLLLKLLHIYCLKREAIEPEIEIIIYFQY